MEICIIATRAPFQTAHFTEAVRIALMSAALENSVHFIMIDEGVLALLEKRGAHFGGESLRTLEGLDNLHIGAHDASISRFIGQEEALEGIRIMNAAHIAELLIHSRTVVF